jgi:hypothetical protein
MLAYSYVVDPLTAVVLLAVILFLVWSAGGMR